MGEIGLFNYIRREASLEVQRDSIHDSHPPRLLLKETPDS